MLRVSLSDYKSDLDRTASCQKDQKIALGLPYPVGVSSTPTVDEDDTSDGQEAAAVAAHEMSSAPMSANVSILTPNRNLIWPEFEINDGRTKTSFGYFCVPIITLGEWQHPYYGDVIFTQADFDKVQQNFKLRAAGYEPALYVGHGSPFDGGGRPAAGFLEALVQNEDVLWGIFAAVCQDTYMATKKGMYRYSSAELTPETIHRQTREELGLVLTGCALTNEPFLTNMPPVRVFNNQKAEPNERTTSTRIPLAIAYELNHNSCVKDNYLFIKNEVSSINNMADALSSTTSTTPTLELSSTTSTPTPIPTPIPTAILTSTPDANLTDSRVVFTATATAVSAEMADVKRELADMKVLVSELAAKNQALSAARSEELRQRRFSTINAATLSSAAKAAFTTALSSASIDDATADALVKQALDLSAAETTTYLSQHGTEDIKVSTSLEHPTASTAPAKQEFAYASYLEQRAARPGQK